MNASGRSNSVKSNKMASSEIIVAPLNLTTKVNLEGQRSSSVESCDSLVNQGDAVAKSNPFKEIGVPTATSGEFGGEKGHKRGQSRDTAAFAAGSG